MLQTRAPFAVLKGRGEAARPARARQIASWCLSAQAMRIFMGQEGGPERRERVFDARSTQRFA